ncbi:hypothetical protein BV22DRAFT_1135447 [Leucogyrophana mollusca]|uniref:Uncharacterized protein n=1 Tax=Leucogyrophana mollusca TaxID=85980 RepID=A0ACB8AWZ9_9AGAM|nr:hypothetical protein BV22DRAFT_1135447 [Leucogyrophana mollusca]
MSFNISSSMTVTAISEALSSIEKDIKAIPYSDLPAKVVRDLRKLLKVLGERPAEAVLARRARAARASLVFTLGDVQHPLARAQLVELDRAPSPDIFVDSPTVLPARPSLKFGAPSFLLASPTADSSPDANTVAAAVLTSAPPSPTRASSVHPAEPLFLLSSPRANTPIPPAVARSRSPSPIASPVATPSPVRLFTPAPVTILDPPRSPSLTSPASPMDVEATESVTLVRRRKPVLVVESESEDVPPEATASDHGSSHRDELADDAPAATSSAKELPLDFFVFENLRLPMYRKGTKVQPPAIGVDEEGEEVFPPKLTAGQSYSLSRAPTSCANCAERARARRASVLVARAVVVPAPGRSTTLVMAWPSQPRSVTSAPLFLIPFGTSSTPVKVEASSTSLKPRRKAARRPLAVMTASSSRAPSKRMKLSVHPPSVSPPPRARTALSNNDPFAVIDAKLESIHSALGDIRFALSVIEGSSANVGKGKKRARE